LKNTIALLLETIKESLMLLLSIDSLNTLENKPLLKMLTLLTGNLERVELTLDNMLKPLEITNST